MQHTTLTFSKEGLTETINDAHHALLKNALAQKIITEEQHSEMIKYVVVVAEKGFFGKLYDRLFDDKGGIFYRVVKIMDA